MEDSEWERTSESWKALIPKRNFNEFDVTDESETEFQVRIAPRFNIPIDVIKQWLYPLYYDRHSTNNYGWINYDNVEFVETSLSYDALAAVNVIEAYRGYVDEGSQYKAYHQFMCIPRDKEHWINFSTWRTPPIILDVQSVAIDGIPEHADIQGPLQIVEGHSRLGYLYSAQNCGVLTRDLHKVFILRYKQT